ncbi:endoglucanase 8-like [Zingiber officinale]|uniref:endoglucanase 8-like n=1 Tax=Zingiber officinale TaxID=94328 RepID=UPI001C4C42C1|nr:endoglucanase 8-like [Zingiber officinale]
MERICVVVCGVLLLMSTAMASVVSAQNPDYKLALSKSLLFFEGQRSGKLPPNQRLTWRKNSALRDGQEGGVDLTGGYYDAGDNVKYSFPMAFTATLLAWSIIEFGDGMAKGDEWINAAETLRWNTDFLLKATANLPNTVYAMVGNPYSDHVCWERPEDMDTPRPVYAVNTTHPGSEVAGEIAAALAAASIAFKTYDAAYSGRLLSKAKGAFYFANTYQGSYKNSIGDAVCPFYCDFSGYQDELAWAAAWLNRATNSRKYQKHVDTAIRKMKLMAEVTEYYDVDTEFSWDNKHVGIYVLLSQVIGQYEKEAQTFACAVLPESPTRTTKFTPGGLLFKTQGCNNQFVGALSLLALIYAKHLTQTNQIITCGNTQFPPLKLVEFAKTQANYILGANPMGMSYMAGYGPKFPRHVHHRGASLPSINTHPSFIACRDGFSYLNGPNPNMNELTGAIVGGPNDGTDYFHDDRCQSALTEPTTYANAAFVGVFAYFVDHN